MEKVIEKSKKYVDKHKKYVKMAFELLLSYLRQAFNLTDNQIDELRHQIEIHDNSKYEDAELVPYANYFFGEQTEAVTKEFREAVNLHKSRNPHHPEYWQQRGETMPLNFIIEMLCDWWAFSLAQDDMTKTLLWYQAKKEKLNLSPQTTKIVEQILDIIKSYAEKEK